MTENTRISASDTCPICHGSGVITFTDDMGYEFAKPCECAERAWVEHTLKASGFPYAEFEKMTFDTFKGNTQEQINMKELAQKFLTDTGLAFGLFGKSGTGKTHLCVALCQELVRKKHYPFVYMPYRTAIRELKSAFYNEQKYCELMSKYVESKVLFIDDLFKFSQDSNGEFNKGELRIIYEIINERYLKGGITIISSEYTGKELMDIDAALGSRIVEMIGEYGHKCSGNNYRLKKGV